MALLEVCCGNLQSVEAAVQGGARRIELCEALELDGVTPSNDLVREVRERFPDLVVHVLIRPWRTGLLPGLAVRDFCYPEEEFARLLEQTGAALEAGADGIVTGCLTPSGDVDLKAMERVMALIGDFNLARELGHADLCHAVDDGHFFPGPHRSPVSVTFHRAFDVCRDPSHALRDIIALGCTRILTSGQAPTAEAGIPQLRKLVRAARGRIGILPGGGVTPGNARRILEQTGAVEIHASAAESIDGVKVTTAGRVAAILAAIR